VAQPPQNGPSGGRATTNALTETLASSPNSLAITVAEIASIRAHRAWMRPQHDFSSAQLDPAGGDECAFDRLMHSAVAERGLGGASHEVGRAVHFSRGRGALPVSAISVVSDPLLSSISPLLPTTLPTHCLWIAKYAREGEAVGDSGGPLTSPIPPTSALVRHFEYLVAISHSSSVIWSVRWRPRVGRALTTPALRRRPFAFL
jgi:hypothetical protein